MKWREWFLTNVGPGLLGGITAGRWFQVLRENRFAIDPPYWLRAAVITLGSVSNSGFAWNEARKFGSRIESAQVQPPLFILGIWRSGTTHLHNLLAKDDRFAFPNNYQVSFPLTFLTREAKHARFVQWFLPKHRPQDNVAMGMAEPQEEEFAFCPLTGQSVTMSWVFARNAAHYDRFLTLRLASADEVNQWKQALRYFVKKLSFLYQKPLILKSPANTGRIRLLLELFPDARFIHIQRDPFAIFRSAEHTFRKVTPYVALQRPRAAEQQERILRQYEEVYDAYFEDLPLIPRGQFTSVRFEDLEIDAIEPLRRIYRELNLPDFAYCEPRVRTYLQSISHYTKNEHAPIPDDLRQCIERRWRRCFEAFGYSLDRASV